MKSDEKALFEMKNDEKALSDEDLKSLVGDGGDFASHCIRIVTFWHGGTGD